MKARLESGDPPVDPYVCSHASDKVGVEVPPGSKAVLTGVPHGMNMEPMKARLESGDPPVDPYMCSQASNNVGPLLNVQGARYPAAGLQINLSTCDPNHLKPTSFCWQSMAIQTMTVHIWPG